ncbi:relaxase/mobilization nuclease [Streptomyces sp. NPDC001093]|uniref:relaxase/mobilization nuclease n=1 Tax=Streptomyces sp. NPDC001093 TaxID=3154376 RepID=UPI003330EB3F
MTAEEDLSEHTVVAYWAGLEWSAQGDQRSGWSAVQWAEHLEEPVFRHPFAAGPRGNGRAITHIDVRLHPDDRELNGAEWAEVAHRLARAAGIQNPGELTGCRWIAVHAQSGRLDLIANLIREDGTWQHQPADLLRRLASEARHIEQDLHLTAITPAPDDRHVARAVPTASAQLATVLAHLADEQSGPLAAVRGLIEHTAHRASLLPCTGPDTAHQLELIARRLYGIQQDLDDAVARLTSRSKRSPAAPVVPAPRSRTRHSP